MNGFIESLIEGESKPFQLDDIEKKIWFEKTFHGDGWNITIKHSEDYPVTQYYKFTPTEAPPKEDELLTGIIHGGTRSKYLDRRKKRIIRRLNRKKVRRLTVRG